MSRARLLFASVTLGSVLSVATLVACGGNVVFVEDGDGTGGSGASGPTTSGPSTSGPTTSGPTSSISTTTVGPSSVSVVSTGTGSFCDTGEQAPIDSNTCSNCADCAQGDPCAFTIDACFNDMECSAFVDCLNNCQSDTCSQQCADQYPMGVQGYYAILDCIVCQACPNNCDAQSNCPFFK